MSSTNRGAERRVADFYPTAAWCVHRLLEAWQPQGELWCDPCAGEGAIVRAVRSLELPVSWIVGDIRPDVASILRELQPAGLFIWDYLKHSVQADVILTNFPFSLAQEFLTKALKDAPTVAALLSLNFLGSAERAAWWHELPPVQLYILPDRPSFSGDGGADSVTYAWYVWQRGIDAGPPVVLATTPQAIRKRDQEETALFRIEPPPLRQMSLL